MKSINRWGALYLLCWAALIVAMFGIWQQAHAGPYVGLTIASDNDVGFCETTGRCETVRAFVGFDHSWGNDIYTDIYASYEDRIDGSDFYNPSRVSATILKRF